MHVGWRENLDGEGREREREEDLEEIERMRWSMQEGGDKGERNAENKLNLHDNACLSPD